MGLKLADDEYLNGYLAYDSGISFFIGKSGNVKTVVVSSRNRKHTVSKEAPKRAGHRSHGANLAVAAMQLR